MSRTSKTDPVVAQRTKLRKLQQAVRQEIRDTYSTIDPVTYRRLGLRDITLQLEVDATNGDSYRGARDLAAVYSAGAELISWVPGQDSANQDDGWDDALKQNERSEDTPKPQKPRDNRGVSPAKIKKVVELSHQGMSAIRIGQALGLSDRTVRKLTQRYIVAGEPIPDDVV